MTEFHLNSPHSFGYLNFSGVYAIQCIATKRIYIGQSIFIGKRICEHIHALQRYTHANPELQLDYEVYGLEGFNIYLMCECDKDKLLEKENQIVTDAFRDGYYLYNRTGLEIPRGHNYGRIYYHERMEYIETPKENSNELPSL